MPTYEYECNACRMRFERRQKMSDEPVKECPDCGAAVRKVLHPVGVVFKGSGFYITDSRRDSDTADRSSTSDVKKDEKPAAVEAKKEDSGTSEAKKESTPSPATAGATAG